MENLIKEVQANRIPGAEVVLVVSDNPTAGALEKARHYGVPTLVVARKDFASKRDFEDRILMHLEHACVDWILLAGFMRILSPEFVHRYEGRILNIHPALLPAFPGAHAIRDAFEAKVPETGVTVHFVDEGVDTGPVILQKKVPIDPTDTLETLEAKVHAVEYELYPEAVRSVLSGRVRFSPT